MELYNYKFRPVERMIEIKHIVSAIDVVRPQDYYFPGEMHDFWEMVFIADGEAMLTADDRVYTLTKGDIILHKPMEFHRIWSHNNTAPHLQIVSFTATGNGMHFFEDKVFSLDGFDYETVGKINAAFKSVIRLSKRDDTAPNEYTAATTQAAMLLERFLFKLYEKGHHKQSQLDRTAAQYETIVRVLNENCCRSLCIEEIAKLCQLSVSNLKRIFHMYSDIGVMKYFTSVKMRYAMQELLAGRAIVDVSEQLHFSSISYFHAVFKKEVGITPKEYIRQNRHL